MNRVEAAIREHGAPLLGMCAYQYNPIFVELVARLGAQVLWIELEHQPITLAQAADLCRIASGVGLLTMIRIPDARRDNVLRAAELDPDLIDLPMANSPEIAAELVRHGKYPPIGERGCFGASRAVRYGLFDDMVAEQQRVNRDLCLMAQIETREALDQVEAICRVPGLDAIFIGPSDLSAALGVTGQMGDPILREAMDRIIGAAKRHGKLLALPGSPTEAGQWAAKGVDLLFLASDVACMRLGAQTLLKQARESLG